MMPVLPLRDVVVYPHMVIPLFVGRDKSIAALEEAMSADRDILLHHPFESFTPVLDFVHRAANDPDVKGFGLSGQNGYPMPAIPEMGAVWHPLRSCHRTFLAHLF